MNLNRSDFLKLGSVGAVGITGGGIFKGLARLHEEITSPELPKYIHQCSQSRIQRFNMSGYAAPKIDTVRIGIIGLGNRGTTILRYLLRIGNLEIKALCDIVPEIAEETKESLEGTEHNPDLYAGSAVEWKKLCQRKDLDLVIITTPWYMHADQAVYAMEQGKHAASEVPAAAAIEECFRLVETSERTRKHCMMMENYSYMEFQLLTLNMAREGFFGEVVHGDCAYNANKIRNNFSKTRYWDMWWLRQYASRKGNIYPTHGLGPVCQIMNINSNDRLDFLVSVESRDFIMGDKASELAEEDDFYKPFVGHDYRGNMNVTTIRTKKGRTIMLQHDASTPSPNTYIHGIHGTNGAALLHPYPPRLSKGDRRWVSQDEFDSLKEKYTPEITKRVPRDSVHGGADLPILWRLIDCLRNGLPLDQNVYEAASLSSVLPLSEWSVLHRSNSIEFPDFTDGSWITNKPDMDINLERGGANTKVI